MFTSSFSLPGRPRPGLGRRLSHATHVGTALAAALAAAAVGVVPAHAVPPGQDPGAPPAVHFLRGPVTDERFYFVMADRFNNGSTANDDGGLGAGGAAGGGNIGLVHDGGPVTFRYVHFTHLISAG